MNNITQKKFGLPGVPSEYIINNVFNKDKYIDTMKTIYKMSERAINKISNDLDLIDKSIIITWNYNDFIKFERQCYYSLVSDEVDLISMFKIFSSEDKIAQYYTYNKFGVCYHYLNQNLIDYFNRILNHNIVINELTNNRADTYDLKNQIIKEEYCKSYKHYYVSEDKSIWFKMLDQECAFEFCVKQKNNNSSYYCQLSININDEVNVLDVFFEGL